MGTDFYFPKLYGQDPEAELPKIMELKSILKTFPDLGVHSTPMGWDSTFSNGIVIGYTFKRDPRDGMRECDLYRLLDADYSDKIAVLKKKAKHAILKNHPDKVKHTLEGDSSPDIQELTH